jgi:hypothetical protein
MSAVHQAGQGTVEYLIAVSLLAMALIVGPNSPLEQLFKALEARYAAFTYAISRP